MILRIDRRKAVGACLTLAGAAWWPSARGCEFFGRNLRITHPWTRATAPEADSAVVSMKFDEVTESDHLIGVATPVASGAELGGAVASPDLRLAIPAGEETLLQESGIYLRLTGLKSPLEVGRSFPMRLVFDKAGVVPATLTVDYARFSFR